MSFCRSVYWRKYFPLCCVLLALTHVSTNATENIAFIIKGSFTTVQNMSNWRFYCQREQLKLEKNLTIQEETENPWSWFFVHLFKSSCSSSTKKMKCQQNSIKNCVEKGSQQGYWNQLQCVTIFWCVNQGAWSTSNYINLEPQKLSVRPWFPYTNPQFQS